ncbi:MAG: leucine-rich repeat domain-containing protein [Prevotellaceae bacterium]|jgi:hypothetical protein|nr:leucine-rich repeat domain-containing protein [Prevotellaceae bacterium]
MEHKIYKTMKGMIRRVYLHTLLSGCFLAMALNGQAQTKMGYSDLYWKINDDTLIITGKGEMPKYSWQLLNTSPWAFKSNIHEMNMRISGPATIGKFAFYGMNFIEVHVPEGVTKIGQGAFQSCMHLASVDIPEGVTTIGIGGFAQCVRLSDIHLPESLTSIGGMAFWGCKSLVGIRLPKGLTSISYWFFRACTNLASVNIPESVTEIGKHAFQGCTSLNEITLNWTNPSACSVSKSAFKKLTVENITLRVPEGTAAKYKSHRKWKKFRITEEK